MKKVTFIFFVLTLMFATSCKKASSSVSGGSWTFKGNTFPASSCTDVAGQLTGTCTSANQILAGGSITVDFYNATNPTTSGTDSVISYNYNIVNLSPNQVSIVLTMNISNTPTYYYSSGTGNARVNVSVAPNGFVTLTGSGITMYRQNNPSDSSTLSISLNQTQ
jgi:hypothetical protein